MHIQTNEALPAQEKAGWCVLDRSTISVPSFAEQGDKRKGMIGAVDVCVLIACYAVGICMLDVR